jgi:hypothetical protein
MASKQIENLPVANPLDGGELVHVVQDGSSRQTTVAAIASGGTAAYHYGSFAVSAIGASEILMDHIVATAHTLQDDFAGCVASVGSAPVADWVANVQLNGASIGSLTVHADGTHTFLTTGGAVAVPAGSVVSVIAPAGADASIARLRFTFKGAI